MLKQTLIAAAALLALAFGASAAEAHGYGHGQGYGYGKSYGYSSHHGQNWNYSYYKPHCVTKTRPVTSRIWNDYSYGYIFRTVYRDYRVCY